ncbi:Uncharacterised protein [Streptococcus acidominimus]|uniref:Uncharacterized protein n=1 Tax=Streptococcus acidominimus TaxID=1326 RepID=A0A380IEP2_STRAI|nr:Uncharacterised protein [Streptococcus acidominimus]
MRAVKCLFVMMVLLPAGYIAFVLSPFLELFNKEEKNDKSK